MSSTDRKETAHEVNSPGWRPVEDHWLWWDGARYTARAEWDGAAWRTEPVATVRSSRPRWWAAAIAGGIVVAVLAMAYGLEQGPLTHDLLDEHFAEDDGSFSTGETDDGSYRAEIRDGRYRLTANGDPGDEPTESFAYFARTAYNVDIETDVAAFDIDDGIIGLECVHAAGDNRAGARYAFSIGVGAPNDDDRYQLVFIDATMTSFWDDVIQFEGAPGPAPAPGQRIGLHCDGDRITGLVDGEPVVTIDDPLVDSFKATALLFGTWDTGSWVEYDDVVAEVPAH